MFVVSTQPTSLFNVVQHSYVMLWLDQSPIDHVIEPPEVHHPIHVHRISYFADSSCPVKVNDDELCPVGSGHEDICIMDVAVNVVSSVQLPQRIFDIVEELGSW